MTGEGEMSGVKMNLTMSVCFSISNSIIKCLCKLARKLNSLSQICFAFKTSIILKFHCRTDICSALFIYSSYFLINLQIKHWRWDWTSRRKQKSKVWLCKKMLSTQCVLCRRELTGAGLWRECLTCGSVYMTVSPSWENCFSIRWMQQSSRNDKS